MIKEVTRQHVKAWVVNNAKVHNPYKKYWSAAVTIGYDYYGKGNTIERAYNDIVDKIMKSPFIMAQLVQFESFKEIWRNQWIATTSTLNDKHGK